MRSISFNKEQTITIGDSITISLRPGRGKTVRLGIDAPSDMRIMRGEVEEPVVQVSSDLDFERKCDQILIFAEHHSQMPNANYRGLYHRIRRVIVEAFPKAALRNTYYMSASHQLVKDIVQDVKFAEKQAVA